MSTMTLLFRRFHCDHFLDDGNVRFDFLVFRCSTGQCLLVLLERLQVCVKILHLVFLLYILSSPKWIRFGEAFGRQ